ncbi:MAG: methyltransferase [Oscillospiraceae bacterium]|jgi:23S rRNA G2445 N2-methylase RlmL|nr:methyltransferase [Oscillospiraceae bacterium]
MEQWYASVNYGLEKMIGDIVKTRGAGNVKALDGAVTFSRAGELDIKCVNNLFLIISEFRSGSIDEAAKRIARSDFKYPQLNGKTFRVVVMDCGKLRAVPGSVMAALEQNISRRTRLTPRRAAPDTEIWINRRNDGLVFFMARVKKHPPFDKALRRGELRRDVAEIMLYMADNAAKTAEPRVIADIFGGWGAIAAAATESGRYKKIFTGDINDECVKYQEARLRGERSCIVQKWDARRLPLKNMSVDAVVTDPPWGEYEKTDVSRLYDEFIAETERILRPGGALVFLISIKSENEALRALDKYGFSHSSVPLRINGKDACLVCAEGVSK